MCDLAGCGAQPAYRKTNRTSPGLCYVDLYSRLVRFAAPALSGYSALQLFTRKALRLRSSPTRRLRRGVPMLFLETLPLFFGGATPCRGGFDCRHLGRERRPLARIPSRASHRYRQVGTPGLTARVLG